MSSNSHLKKYWQLTLRTLYGISSWLRQFVKFDDSLRRLNKAWIVVILIWPSRIVMDGFLALKMVAWKMFFQRGHDQVEPFQSYKEMWSKWYYCGEVPRYEDKILWWIVKNKTTNPGPIESRAEELYRIWANATQTKRPETILNFMIWDRWSEYECEMDTF